MEFPRIPRTGMHLRDVFSQAYRAQPLKAEGGRDLTPVESMLLRSQGIDLLRQYMPPWLGGYSQERMESFDNRRIDPDFREKTMRVGSYPDIEYTRDGAAANAARRVAQGAGALTADVTTQGAQNLWWFINAFQAASSAAAQQAMHGVLGPSKLLRRPAIDGAPTGSPFGSSGYKVAATFPVVLGASAAAGNLFRQPGYASILPGEEDRRESENPVLEATLRGIGMSGKLLPYEDFIKERPDVSRGEYESYKAYLYGSPMPVKFNPDGIHGAEVSFIGKSIPLLTGVLPVAGGVAGAAVGLRMAGRRLAGSGRGNKFQSAARIGEMVDKTKKESRNLSSYIEKTSKLDLSSRPDEAQRLSNAYDRLSDLGERIEKGGRNQRQAANKVQDTLFLGAIGGSSAGLVTTGAAAALLEQIRRANNYEENKRREQEQLPATG